MVKRKNKLWCPITKVHGSKLTPFGKTFQVSIPGVQKILAITENCINEEAKQAFSTGSKLPPSAQVKVNRAFWDLYKIWRDKQAVEKKQKRKATCTIKKIKVRAGWCSKAHIYIKRVNEILTSNKASYPKLIEAMKSDLKPPEDIAKCLTTTQFLCNKLTRHHLDPEKAILHPTPDKPGYISW